MQALSSYEHYAASDFHSSPLKVSRNPNPAPKTIHPLEINPVLNLWTDDYLKHSPAKVKQCFIDQNLTATNFMQVLLILSREVQEIQEAIGKGCCKETLHQIEDLAIKATCMAILSKYITRLYPTL